MKKKKFAQKIKEVIKPKETVKSPEPKCFETTDKVIVDKLMAKGFTLKTVIRPQGDRLNKLYVFNETEEQAKGVLNA